MDNFVAAGATERVLPLPIFTAFALTALCKWGVYVDIIELDAVHEFHSAWADINLVVWAVLRAGGVMFGHYYFTATDDHGVRRSIHDAVRQGQGPHRLAPRLALDPLRCCVLC